MNNATPGICVLQRNDRADSAGVAAERLVDDVCGGFSEALERLVR